MKFYEAKVELKYRLVQKLRWPYTFPFGQVRRAAAGAEATRRPSYYTSSPPLSPLRQEILYINTYECKVLYVKL